MLPVTGRARPRTILPLSPQPRMAGATVRRLGNFRTGQVFFLHAQRNLVMTSLASEPRHPVEALYFSALPARLDSSGSSF
jgi:hypothetical protein